MHMHHSAASRPLVLRDTGGWGNPRDRASRAIGQWLRETRTGMGLTLDELAERIADHLGTSPLSRSQLSGYELGRGRVPAPEVLEAVCHLAGQDPVEVGKFLLMEQNPWIYRMLFGLRGQPELAERLRRMSRREEPAAAGRKPHRRRPGRA